jgi:hypothetical protein
MVDRGFEQLPPELQRGLRLYSISPADWDALRTAPDHFQIDGRTFLTPDAADRSQVQMSARARDMLALKLRTYYGDVADRYVITPNIADQRYARLGSTAAPGTIAGEAMRFIAQFKTWPVAAMRQGLGRELSGGQGVAGAITGIVHLAIMGTAFGYLRMAISDLSKGITPRDPSSPATWLAALAQGGGAGILGDFLPENGDAWGLLLRWKDRDGREHEWIMPRRLLAGEAAEVRQRFADCGLDVSGTDVSRRALVQFLADVKHSARVRTVGQTGWYRPATGGVAFVLPGSAVGHLPGEIVRLDIDPPPSVYRTRSPLQEWRDRVASLCAGNSRAVFAIGCGFAAPLLPLLSDEGGGFNFRGESSKGKTTLIDAAATVWGVPSKTDADAFVRQWRSTGNALEATAAAHNHVLLPMDELGQADPRGDGGCGKPPRSFSGMQRPPSS